MRALILGTDFTYDSEGKLRPIELNTNSSINRTTIEKKEDIFQLDKLKQFIINKNFRVITYIGGLNELSDKLYELCVELNIEYTFIEKGMGVSIPYVEDSETHLIIRSAYDNAAIVDELYCKNKVNYLNLISKFDFGSQFAYIDDETTDIVSYISEFPDNGTHPNFIMKAIYPEYDSELLPKLYKINSIEQLEKTLETLEPDQFLMEYYFNSEKLYENQMKVLRAYNMVFPPDLDNIALGFFTKLTSLKIDENSTYNEDTFQLDSVHRNKYLTVDAVIGTPKLIDTDRVEMADGTTKTALELEIGDIVKTISIYNPNDIDLKYDSGNFKIDFNSFVSGSTYSTNVVLSKIRVDKLVNILKITFTDGTTWSDTENSSYLALRNDEVRYLKISQINDDLKLRAGDQIILIDTSNDEILTPILKTIEKIEESTSIFSGWEIDIDETNIFLTLNNEGQNFAAIEHNVDLCKSIGNCLSQLTCPKGLCCCSGLCLSCQT